MYPFAAAEPDIVIHPSVHPSVRPSLSSSCFAASQDIDFAALYRAYDDELMAWKNSIDERHKGEKESPGASAGRHRRHRLHPRPALTHAPLISAEPAVVMEITLVNWCAPSSV